MTARKPSNGETKALRLARYLLGQVSLWALFIFSPSVAFSQTIDEQIKARLTAWEAHAAMCKVGAIEFPTKQRDSLTQPCEDGDMTLFNGLLCAAGDVRGCNGVKDAQDKFTGKWHRSPRIRVLGKNDQGDADFSPDMALGVALYSVRTGAASEVYKWLTWISDSTPCLIQGLKPCPEPLKLHPRFCEVDACVIRPQDYQTLAFLVDYLQKRHGMPPLPDGRLRGLIGSFNGYADIAKTVAALVNEPGFSQHLVGSSVLLYLLRDQGYTSSEISLAANILRSRNPGNAFFTYLSEGKGEVTKRELLERCVADPTMLRRPLFQWQWERANESKAWEQSSLWDCIFMERLLR